VGGKRKVDMKLLKAVFWLGGNAWTDRWFLYGTIWFAILAASEIGEAVSGRTSRQESGLGILAEAIYAPWSAFVFHALLLQA
jgi:hypothetical protein